MDGTPSVAVFISSKRFHATKKTVQTPQECRILTSKNSKLYLFSLVANGIHRHEPQTYSGDHEDNQDEDYVRFSFHVNQPLVFFKRAACLLDVENWYGSEQYRECRDEPNEQSGQESFLLLRLPDVVLEFHIHC